MQFTGVGTIRDGVRVLKYNNPHTGYASPGAASAPDPDLQEANAVTGVQGEEKGDEQQITPAPRI
jgi:hypothetical protein|tara:strand:- start:223 stop:417 length:195 start_codon:yes stop_codon:yes gene_type:complete